MQVQYATTPQGERTDWPMAVDARPTRGLIIGGGGSGKTETLCTLVAHAKNVGMDVWSCSGDGEDHGGVGMELSQLNDRIRSYTGTRPILAVADEPSRWGPTDLDLADLERNPKVTVILTRRANAAPVVPLRDEDVLLDLGAGRSHGGPGRGIMRCISPGRQDGLQVAVDYLPHRPIARQ